MKTLKHRRFKRSSTEGITIYTKDLGRGQLQNGQIVTLFYDGGYIATGKVSRDGTTLYISKKNFTLGWKKTPYCGRPRNLKVVKISISKTRE